METGALRLPFKKVGALARRRGTGYAITHVAAIGRVNLFTQNVSLRAEE